MIWVPPGYSYGEAMFGLDEVRGGSGYGTGTFAGPTGARQPSKVELGQAEHQVHQVYDERRVTMTLMLHIDMTVSQKHALVIDKLQ